MQNNASVPSRGSALVTVPGLSGIYRRDAEGRARGDRYECAYVISDRRPGDRQESNTFRAEPLGGRAEQPAIRVARLEHQRRGGEA
jgi:hypothetical protein